MMASLKALGPLVPFTLLFANDGFIIGFEVLLGLKFEFQVGTMYMEQEMFDDNGMVFNKILM